MKQDYNKEAYDKLLIAQEKLTKHLFMIKEINGIGLSYLGENKFELVVNATEDISDEKFNSIPKIFEEFDVRKQIISKCNIFIN